VTAGQVLALSGQSGTSGPHLHFEVRGPDGLPRDPLAHGFAVPDTMAPEILAVRAVNSTSSGPPSLVVGDGRGRLTGELPPLRVASGDVRFSARLVERSDHLRYRLGPWRVTLRVDGREVLTATNEVLHWRRNRHQRLEFVTTELGQERWLVPDPRNRLAGREGAAWFGTDPLAPGDHRFELEAADRAGNTSRVTWTVTVAAGSSWSGWSPGPPVLPEAWRVTPVGPVPREGRLPGDVPVLEWRRGWLDEPVTDAVLRLAGLEVVSLPVQLRAAAAPMLEAVTVPWSRFEAIDPAVLADPTVALYALDDDRWEHAADLRAGVAVLDAPGIYALCRDREPPVVVTATVPRRLERRDPERRHGISLPRWPRIVVPVGDHGSGVDWSTVAVKLDGAPLVAEPDAPRDRLLVELPDGLAAGVHRLEVAVADRAGHRTRRGVDLDLVVDEATAGGGAP
jgi:hypothetical protein